MRLRRALSVVLVLLGIMSLVAAGSSCSVLKRGLTATPTPTKTPPVGSAEATDTSNLPAPSPTPQRSYEQCPLTGVQMADPSLGMRRPLDIKVDNYPGSRPPSGLNKADVVFEHYAEGAITRFSAIFLCQDAELVGPVRSARLIDVEHLVDMFDAVLVHYGAANRVLPMIREAGFPDLDGYFGAKGFFSVPGRVSPFNKYCDTTALWAEATEQGWQRPADRPGFTFADAVEWETRAKAIEVTYAPQSRARWLYDEATGLYVRYAGEEQHTEETSGEPLQATNVIVLEARHVQTDIDEGYGSFSVRIELLGQGLAMVFRDGRMAEGTWVRRDHQEMIQILDENGNPLALKPGNVWVQVVPNVEIVDTGS